MTEKLHLHNKRVIIDDLECTIMFCGEPAFLFDNCLEKVRNQTFLPKKIEVIENISPINEAVTMRHRKMDLPYSIKVDADMILRPACFEILYKAIKNSSIHCWAVSALLTDSLQDTIGAIHIQKTEYLKDVVVPNVLGCDRWLAEEMKKQGLFHQELPVVLGEHRSDWSLEAAFKRFVRVGQKEAYFRMTKAGVTAKKLSAKWNEGSGVAGLALIAYCYGLLTPDKKEKGKDFMNDEWGRIEKLIEDKVILTK